VNVPRLANPVTAILRLRIHGGVPVAVVEDDGVRPRQVDAHATRPRAQDEAEVLAVVVEAIHQQLAHLHLGLEWKFQLNLRLTAKIINKY